MIRAEKEEEDQEDYTFNLQLGRVPDLGGWVAGNASEVSGMTLSEARNAEKARVRVKGRYVDAKRWRQGLTILQPTHDERWISATHAAHRSCAHALA